MEATTGSQIDFKNPYWLRSIGGVIPVSKERPSDTNGAEGESDFERLMTGLKDAVHSLVNNTCRACGLPMEGADSEATWDFCKRVGNSAEDFIRHEWKRQDDDAEAQRRQDAEDARMLQEYLDRVNAARRRQGQPDFKLIATPPPTGVPPT